MALFYFLRHGETAWNAEGRVCGSTDIPLSDAGRRQAQALAQRLQSTTIETLYSSPLSRALGTAQVVGEAIGREPIVDNRLVELNYGAWEGQTFEEIKRGDPALYQAWDADPGSLAPPQGETGAHVIARVTPFLVELAHRHQNGNVAVVCHKTVCRLLACHMKGMPLAEYRRLIPMENAALNIFETVDEDWRVVTLNDTAHLPSTTARPETRAVWDKW